MSIIIVKSWMLKIVMAKPMQETIVNAVPFISEDAFWATKVEKSGESAITTMPQKSKKQIKKFDELLLKSKGEIRQQQHDKNKASKAILFVPNDLARYAPTTQASPPIAITINEINGILKLVSGCMLL